MPVSPPQPRHPLEHVEATTWRCPICGRLFLEPADLAIARVAREVEQIRKRLDATASDHAVIDCIDEP